LGSTVSAPLVEPRARAKASSPARRARTKASSPAHDQPPISVKQLHAMANAAALACAELHYPDLWPVVAAISRTPVAGDDNGSERKAAARKVWNANTVSESLTDDRFDDAFEAVQCDGGITAGTFRHWAAKGGWQHPDREYTPEEIARWAERYPENVAT